MAAYERNPAKDQAILLTSERQADDSLEERQQAALRLLRKTIRMKRLNETLSGFEKAVELGTAVSRDEVYGCPLLVRSIVTNCDETAKLVAKVLSSDTENVKILLSCAGTVAARTSIGFV